MSRAAGRSRRAPAQADRDPGPRWPWVTGIALSLVGLCVAAYLTYEHYTSSKSLSCPAGGGVVNCFKVTTSSYSMIHGVPVAMAGLVFFAVMLPLQARRAWASRHVSVRAGRVVWALVGVASVVWLVYAEAFKIRAICLWCTVVHVVTVALFVSTVLATAAAYEPDWELEDEVVDGPGAPDP